MTQQEIYLLDRAVLDLQSRLETNGDTVYDLHKDILNRMAFKL